MMFKKALSLLPFVAVLFFLPALSGPLLLDDTIHLDPIQNWLAARTDTYALIFGNQSGPFGRPVSIISFLFNAVTTGNQVWAMKLTNLLLHLITGLVLSKLFYRLFKRDANLQQHAKIASIIAASLWLLLPQHVATVFYVIQRMMILATLFSVLACWLYVVARERIENNLGHGLLLLSGVVVLILLAVLSKENALLVPLYCLLIECVYFRPITDQPRPKIIAWGFRLGLIYPGLFAAAFLAFHPGFVLDGYIDREFSMPERLMTQIPVLADYFASTFFPMARSAGVFNDDFPIVHALAVREILLLLAAIGLIFSAIRLRKNYPGCSAGIGLFFIGHLLESSIFSLEIYFVHRNYLPSMGLILTAFGLAAGLVKKHQELTNVFKRSLPFAVLVLFTCYGFSSYNRAKIWSNNESLMADALVHHPASSRLHSELLLSALYSKRIDIALLQADLAMQTSSLNEKRTIQLWRILAYCYVQKPVPGNELQALKNMPADRITIDTSTALGYVSAAAEVNACPDLDRKELGSLTSQWAINTIQPPSSPWVWKAHLASARLLASSGDLAAGFKQANWAFTDSGYDYDIGILAWQLANSLENKEQAAEILSKLQANMARYTQQQQQQLRSSEKN
jgi:protein O-mannosyl-transferase